MFLIVRSAPDCLETSNSLFTTTPIISNRFDSYCENGAVCVSKLFDNECISCTEPYYGEFCEIKSKNIRFDQSRMSNLTIKLDNINERDSFELSFNFKPNFNLISSSEKNEKDFFFESTTNTNDVDSEISFFYLLNSQTNESLKLSFTLIVINNNNVTNREAYLNFYSKNTQNNLLMIKNFIKKSLINNKFYKLNIQLKDNSQIVVKINELSLSVNIDYKYSKNGFDTIVISNKFYGLINAIKVNEGNINYDQNLDDKQMFQLNDFHDYAIVEQPKCLFEK